MAVAIRGIHRRFGVSAFSYATIEFTNTILGAQIREEALAQKGAGCQRVEILPTDHEREILEHLVNGLSNKEIASENSPTEATAKYHLRRIYAKFGARPCAMAVVMARNASIVV